ncbi:MAG: hypothetical protein M0D57_11265 [Sphingobacteriales bacterium JAD_PAG50586_3]|nr:MAG: hypothetical protein M0D57_11265 [Sphingobacteriales bacterium JAD_PAG50586_3]
MKTQYYSRIVYNTENYIIPSGLDGKSTTLRMPERIDEFVRDEWLNSQLFCSNEFQFGYIQSIDHAIVNNWLSRGDELDHLFLYSINSNIDTPNRINWVGRIDGLAILTTDEATDMHAHFGEPLRHLVRNSEELSRIYANRLNFLNVRFENIEIYDRPRQFYPTATPRQFGRYVLRPFNDLYNQPLI